MVGGRLVTGATDGGNPAAYHGTPRPRARPARCAVAGSPASTPSSFPWPCPPLLRGGGDSPAPQVTPFAARVPGGEELHRVGTLVKDGVLGASLLNPFLRFQPCDCRGPTKACTHVFGSAHCYDLGFDSALRGIPFFPFLVNMTFFQLFCPLLSRPWAGGCVVLSVASKVWLCTGRRRPARDSKHYVGRHHVGWGLACGWPGGMWVAWLVGLTAASRGGPGGHRPPLTLKS